jgi:hypothetical protein
LAKERKRIWEEDLRKDGDPPKLFIHGCEDHVLNLMSKDYEHWLVKNSHDHLLIKKKKHRATDVVQFIISKVCFSFSKPFHMTIFFFF